MKLGYIKIVNGKGGISCGGNQSDFGGSIGRSGCGMIAACDILLYMQGRRILSDSEYRQFVNSAGRRFFYRRHFSYIGVTAHSIVKFLRSNGCRFRFVPKRKLSGGRLEQLVREAIGRDTPVIVRIGLNGKRLPYSVKYTVNGRTSHGIMSWHYITVTGIENGVLNYISWGATGEMPADVLQKNLGFMGGIFVPD